MILLCTCKVYPVYQGFVQATLQVCIENVPIESLVTVYSIDRSDSNFRYLDPTYLY